MLSLVSAFLLAVLPISAAAPVSPADNPGPASKPPAGGGSPGLPAWWGRVSVGDPGGFPPPQPFKASYRVGWEGLDSAQFELECTLPDGGKEISTLVKAWTIGLARTLWKFDAVHLSLVDRSSLKPLRIEQTEDQGRKKSVERVDFTPQEAVRTESDTGADGVSRPPRTRRYGYPGLFDMESAFLYMRSLPLAIGETRTLAVMTAGSPYLVTIKVVGQGRVQVQAGEFPTFEYAMTMEKVNKYGGLEQRKGFKSAHAWVSNDANRLIVKAQADVFVGTVTVELENVQFAPSAAGQ